MENKPTKGILSAKNSEMTSCVFLILSWENGMMEEVSMDISSTCTSGHHSASQHMLGPSYSKHQYHLQDLQDIT